MTITSTTNRGGAWAAITVRLLLAAIFLVSAVAKLIAIDDFELYIFSYALLPLNICYLLARLCIAVELALGGLLAMGWWRRWVNLASLLLLIAFSLFLGYAALIGRTDSCQCMGRLADFPPTLSLLKNAALILLFLLLMQLQKRIAPPRPKAWLRWVVGLGIALAALIIPFAVSVPDNWIFGEEEAAYNQTLLEQTITDRGLDQERVLVAFVTPGCRYCKWAKEKLTSIQKRHHIAAEKMVFIEPKDITTDLFLGITYGQRPFIVLLDHGQPVATYHYRNISEKRLSTFLQ